MRRLVVLLVSILLTACAGVPTVQLQAYTNAYDEAKDAAALIYADAGPALVQGGLRSPDYVLTLGPPTMDRDGCGAVVASIDELRARCQAMASVKAYNQALLDLASGKGTDDILKQVDQAFRSVSTVVGLVPTSAAFLAPAAAVFPALKSILGEAIKIRDRAALHAKLMEAAPHVRAVIELLRDDVDKLYVVHRAYAVGKLRSLQSGIDGDVNTAFRIVAGSSGPGDAAAASALALLQQRFEDLFSAPEPTTGNRLKDIKPGAGAGGKPIDAAAVAAIESTLRAAGLKIAEWRSVAAQFHKSAEGLTRYDRLLASVDKAFSDLVTASNQPFAAGGGTEQYIQSIVTVRDHARDIKQLLSAR